MGDQTETVAFRVPGWTKLELRAEAARRGVGLSTWLRDVVMSEVQRARQVRAADSGR